MTERERKCFASPKIVYLHCSNFLGFMPTDPSQHQSTVSIPQVLSLIATTLCTERCGPRSDRSKAESPISQYCSCVRGPVAGGWVKATSSAISLKAKEGTVVPSLRMRSLLVQGRLSKFPDVWSVVVHGGAGIAKCCDLCPTRVTSWRRSSACTVLRASCGDHNN